MKEVRLKFFLAAFVVIALMGLTVLLQQADAGRLAGGFSGGSLRGYGGEVTGPRGSEIAEGPLGGVAAEGPRGGGIAEGPGGARVAVGPDGRAIARTGRGAYWGPPVDAVPDDADDVTVGDQEYWVSNGVYYQQCYVGSDVYYCVVPAPSN
jgi:hypothetical protein